MTFFSPIEQGIDVDVFTFSKDGNKSEQLDFQSGKEMHSVCNIDAVAVIPHMNDCFTGVKSMDQTTFNNKGNMSGYATML